MDSMAESCLLSTSLEIRSFVSQCLLILSLSVLLNLFGRRPVQIIIWRTRNCLLTPTAESYSHSSGTQPVSKQTKYSRPTVEHSVVTSGREGSIKSCYPQPQLPGDNASVDWIQRCPVHRGPWSLIRFETPGVYIVSGMSWVLLLREYCCVNY